MRPPKIAYLRFGEAEIPIMGPAVEIVGNARALLQLRRQIDPALKDRDSYPLDDAIYRDNNGHEYEVVVRWARSREEMEPPVPKPQKAPERLPWAAVARDHEARGEKERGR